MFKRPFLSLILVALTGSGVATLAAQQRYDPGRLEGQADAYPVDLPDELWDRWQDIPAFVSYADGYVELDRAGRPSRDVENVPLAVGDRLRTTRGRAEILFDDGSTIALDEHSTLTFRAPGDADLTAGRVRLLWRSRDVDFTVATPAGFAITRATGDYRITLASSRRGDLEVELAVARGSAELANDLGRTLVREGTRALTTLAYAPSVPYAYQAPRDEFERWTDGLEADRYGVESTRYLPDDLRYYGGVFDRYGSWQRHPNHGYVWYPRVNVGWRPYNSGRWSFVIGFGYSWVGGARWSWPTHHYGRWDCVGTQWFWIPSTPVRHRYVGFAAPRRSYTAAVTYYSRPTNANGSFRGTNTVNQPGRAVPRSGADRFPAAALPPTNRPQTSRPAASPIDGGRNTTRRLPDAPTAMPRSSTRTAAPSMPQGTSRQAPSATVRRSAPPTRTTAPERSGSTARPSEPARATPTRRSPPPASTRAPQRSAPAPRGDRPTPSRAAPTRSTPPPSSAAPPSGSRTPTRSGGNTSSGNARRRGGGGGGGGI